MPKPLILVCGKPIIEHIVESLPEVIDELIIVVGYKGEMIEAYCGTEFHGKRVSYVRQVNPKAGTADALMYARDIAQGKFLVVYADDIHGSEALAAVVKTDAGMLAARSLTPEKYGVLVLEENGTLREIVEKPEIPPSNYVNIGGFVVTDEIFKIQTELSASGEYYLTDTITEYAKKYPVSVVEQGMWVPVGCPDDIKKAEAQLCPR
jgi:bifunctional UDP-N-acetylglucosamine pyrophosphorylase/glucosamine-1-phosphate N-acetyltransferase